MTFLQYVLTRCLGPPAYRGSDSYVFHCPRHEDVHPSLRTRPSRAGYKDRFRCYGCEWWGDEMDVLKEIFPVEDYGQRQYRIEQLRQAYERDVTNKTIPSEGDRRMKMDRDLKERVLDETFSPEATQAITAILESVEDEPNITDSVEVLKIIQNALEICGGTTLHPYSLAERVGAVAWTRELERKHLAECTDPDCDTYMCRAKRGLPPLTREEIENFKRESQERHEELMEKIRDQIFTSSKKSKK